MDRQTQGREIRKLVAAPDFMLGSVAAVTEEGTLVAASATGSQLGAYAAGAGRVILVVGSQKIVPDLDAALRRIDEVVFPYENAQVFERLGVDTVLEKVLMIYGEWQPAEPRSCSSASRSASEGGSEMDANLAAVGRPGSARARVPGRSVTARTSSDSSGASTAQGMAWLAAVGRDRMRIIGTLEILGADRPPLARRNGRPALAHTGRRHLSAPS